MRPQVWAFKREAIAACNLKNFSFTDFMDEWGLEAILTDAEANNTAATQIATRVLAECCITNGKFNNFQVGMLTVLQYLNATFGALEHGQEQAMSDLLSILKNGGPAAAIQKWMDTHYPN
jgi:hypothetical protein